MNLVETHYLYRFPESASDNLDFLYYFLEDQIREFSFYTRNLYELADLKMGFGFSSDDYVEEGISLLRIGDFIDEMGIAFSGNRVFLPENFYVDFSEFRVTKGHIVVALTGATIGKTAICELSDRILLNQRILRISPNNKTIGKFLFWAVTLRYVQLQILQLSCGGAQPNIGIDALRKLRIPFVNQERQGLSLEQLAPLEEEFVLLLSRAKESLSEANRILLDELGIDLAGRETGYFFREGRQDSSDYYFRFNDEISDRFHYLFDHPKLEILVMLRNRYKTVRLKEICREPIHAGKQPEYSDFGVMVIKTIDLKNRFIDYENTLRVSEDFYESKPKAHIQENDILVSSAGYVSMGKIDIFDIDEPAMADPQLLIIRLNEREYDIDFVTYYLRSSFGQIQFDKYFSGSSGQIHLYSDDIGEFIIPSKDAISKNKQKEIADKITEEYRKACDYEHQAQAKRQEAKESFEKLILQGVDSI